MSTRSVAVFCGSRDGQDPAYRALATDVGRALAQAGYGLVYGGGRVGLMGAVADGALAAGGRVHGVIPELLRAREVAHLGLSALDIVPNMHERKRRMFELADAFVALPGGPGTLDELIEILTWRQLGLHQKPSFLLDHQGYYAPFRVLIEHIARAGFASAEFQGFYEFVPDRAALLQALAARLRPEAGRRL